MMRFSFALISSLAFSMSACAAETPSGGAADAPQTEAVSAAAMSAGKTLRNGYDAPASAWRDVDPENLLVIDTAYGRIGVELYPEIAPRHVAQIKTLTRQKFYDMITFHRVIDGFMNQTGDPKGDGTGDSSLPDIEAEFTFRRPPTMPITLFDARKTPQGEVGVGFYKALPVASQPASQAILTKDGKVGAYGLHCSGVTSMARSGNPNSGNSQFFLMRGTAPHLDTQYSIWGSTVYGRELLTRFKVGTKGDDAAFIPDVMEKVQIAADMPDGERLKVKVLKPDSPAFKQYLTTQKTADGSYPDICDITIPSRKF
jgi:peptidylprolyl isomerase